MEAKKPIDFIDLGNCPHCYLWTKPSHNEIPQRSYYSCEYLKYKTHAEESCTIIDYKVCPMDKLWIKRKK